MATKPKKKFFLEGFTNTTSIKHDWYLRITMPTKSRGSNKFAVTEGYAGQKAGVKRAAQSLVNGMDIPVVRLNLLAPGTALVAESWVLRPGQKAERIDVKASTPLA